MDAQTESYEVCDLLLVVVALIRPVREARRMTDGVGTTKPVSPWKVKPA